MPRNHTFRGVIVAAIVSLAAVLSPVSTAAEDAAAAACVPLTETSQVLATSPPTRDPADVPLDGRLIVSPAIVTPDDPVDAGSSLQCTITIRNRQERVAEVTLEANGMVGSRRPRAGVEFIEPTGNRFDDTAGPWLSILQDGPLSIPPRGVVKVQVVVDVPTDAPGGGSYAALVISPSESTKVEGKTSLGIRTSIAVPFQLDVGGTGRSKLRLRDVDAPRVRWDRDAWTLRGKLDNDGTTDATPRGRVRVRSVFGNVVEELPLATTGILPRGRSEVSVTWDNVPWLGIYRYDVRMANAAPGSDDPVARASGWFVALPPAWVLGLVALLVGVASWRLRRNGRTDNEDQDEDEFGPDDDHMVDAEPD